MGSTSPRHISPPAVVDTSGIPADREQVLASCNHGATSSRTTRKSCSPCKWAAQDVSSERRFSHDVRNSCESDGHCLRGSTPREPREDRVHRGLNERQQAVLDWVGQGSPDGVWPDSTYKVSAQALQSRWLINITKRRGHWITQLTDKGRQDLTDRGIRPAEQNAEPPKRPGRRPTPPRPKTVPKVRTNYADQLLEELAANDGCLIKPLEPGPRAVNWASRVNAARKSGKIPHTQGLYGYRTHRGYEIKLVDIPAWRFAELTPLPVPARLAKPHSVVAALQKQPQPMGLTKPVQGRALRIIQSLITATEKQGHRAALGTTQGAPPPHRRRKAPPHFTITAQGESVGFLVLQEQDRSQHVPTDKEHEPFSPERIRATWSGTASVEDAAQAFGMSRSKGYDLVRRGEFPCRVLLIGRAARLAPPRTRKR